MKDVIMMIPPLCVNEYPLLSLPIMAAYLKSRGINDICMHDYNAEIMIQVIRDRLYRVVEHNKERGISTELDVVQNQFEKMKKDLQSIDIKSERRTLSLYNAYIKMAGSDIYDTAYDLQTLEQLERDVKIFPTGLTNNEVFRFIKRRIIQDIKSYPAKIIVISVTFASQIFYSFLIAKMIKEINSDCVVVLEGAQIELFYEIFMKSELKLYFDFLSMGRTGGTIECLLRYINNEINIEEVDGLIYFDVNKNIVVNEVSQNDIMGLMPDYSWIKWENYLYKKIPYKITEGCYWGNCTFCTYTKHSKCISKNIDKVISDIVYLKNEYGVNRFQFIDDAISPEIINQLAKQLIEQKVDIHYESYLRLDDKFLHSNIEKLYESGLRGVLFGLETVNPHTLQRMNKGIKIENVHLILEAFKNAKISTIISCIIGFPREGEADAQKTIDFLVENKRLYTTAVLMHFGMISDTIMSHPNMFGIAHIDKTQFRRYDEAGFMALEFIYQTVDGMNGEDIDRIIRIGYERLGIETFNNCFFS